VVQSSVLEEGLQWDASTDTIEHLNKMLWALEALRIFRDRLTESLNKISQARQLVEYNVLRVS
jgi:hypothetical protein